jgi:hypothetical protein
MMRSGQHRTSCVATRRLRPPLRQTIEDAEVGIEGIEGSEQRRQLRLLDGVAGIGDRRLSALDPSVVGQDCLFVPGPQQRLVRPSRELVTN